MNTKVIMGASAVFMAVLGILATFLPQEVLAYLGSPPEGREVIAVEIAGALYMGFAIQNWMARENLIGGVYSRPVALGNFLHFVVVAIALARGLVAGGPAPEVVVGAVAYALFALSFGTILVTHPGRQGNK